MKALVIGLGSMGKRRIRLLKQLSLIDGLEIIGMDTREERRLEAESVLGIQTVASIQQAVDEHPDINAAFVCTSPLSHGGIIRQCLLNGWHVFTEINLVSDGYEENIRLAKERGLTLFLSSTPLYRREVAYIREKVSAHSGRLDYIYHVGQYLPDWHPWENYKDFFVNEKRSNGCREIFAIELPWMTQTFGSVKSFDVLSDRMSGLAIDYDDNYLLKVEHESGIRGILAVDVVSPAAIRYLEIYGDGLHIRWDGTPSGLFAYDGEQKKMLPIHLYEQAEHMDHYQAFAIENAYRKEIETFLDILSGHRNEDVYGYEDDEKVLQLIDSIEAGGTVG